MSQVWRSAFLAVAFVLFASAGWAEEPEQSIYEGPDKARLDALAKIQPGLGTLMVEFGNRFVDVYFAAKGGNWGLADYQLEEMVELIEVGELTRPEKAPLLQSFEHEYLDALKETVDHKEWGKFHALYKDAAEGCNACHEATDHPFIHFQLPSHPVEAYLDFNRKTEPGHHHEEEEEEHGHMSGPMHGSMPMHGHEDKD